MAQDFEKPEITQTNITGVTDIQLLMFGLQNFQQDDGLTSNFKNASQKIPHTTNDIEPFNSERCLNAFDKVFEGHENINVDEILPQNLEELKKSFAEIGSEGIFDDGIITKEELIKVGAARGNLELQENPEDFNLSEEDYNAAEAFLNKHGINDPSGSLARGVAAQAQRLSERANQGLGFNADGSTPQPTTPTITAESTVTSSATATQISGLATEY